MSLIQQALEKAGRLPKSPKIEYPVPEPTDRLQEAETPTVEEKKIYEEVPLPPPPPEEEKDLDTNLDSLEKKLVEELQASQVVGKRVSGFHWLWVVAGASIVFLLTSLVLFLMLLKNQTSPVQLEPQTVSAPAVPAEKVPERRLWKPPVFGKEKKSAYTLTGVTSSHGRKLALINNQIFAAGDRIGPKTVLKQVGNRRVILQQGDKEVVLTM